MANRFIVASFDDETAAFETAQAIATMGENGVLTIKRGAIVSKDANGKWRTPAVRDEGSAWAALSGEPSGVLLGMLFGQFAAFGGPAAERAPAEGSESLADFSHGVPGDSLSDAVELGLGAGDFLNSVGPEIEPGQTVCFAEVDEGSTEPIDAAVKRRGGRVFRIDR